MSAASRVIADRAPRRFARALRSREALLALLFALVFAVSGWTLPHFLDPYNLADSTFNFSEKGLLALATSLLIIVREIDLSIAAIMALAALAMGTAAQHGASTPGLVALGIGVGAACGAFNGALVTGLAVPSIVVTIGSLALFRGLCTVALGDQALSAYPAALTDWAQGYAFAVPHEFWLLLAAAGGYALLLHATAFGRELFALGSNPVAARMSGVPVARHRFVLFILSGATAGLAAVLLTGRIGVTRPNLAQGWELDAVTLAILGGASIRGGSGTIGGVVLATLTLGLATYALGMANVPGIIMNIVVGALLLFAVAAPAVLKFLRDQGSSR